MKKDTSTPVFAKPVLPAVLKLTVKKEWFDLIKSGEKTEEYREIKEYWEFRLIKEIKFKNFSYWDSLKELKGTTFVPDFSNLTEECIKNSVRFKEYAHIEFKNGYSQDAPTIIAKCKGISVGKPTQNGKHLFDKNVFIISIGDIIWSNCR